MSELRIGIIGGSGLAQALGGDAPESIAHDPDTPFGKPSGVITETRWDGVPVFQLARHGVGHLLPPNRVPYHANIFALKSLGVTHILATGAVGSLRDEYAPRDLVIPEQIIDKTRRDGSFYDAAAVHVEFAEPFCQVLRSILVESGEELVVEDKPVRVHDGGCYVAMEGPAFSTRAESLMHRLWGGDLIGMTAMPEAKLAREAEIAYGLVALVTDFDAWKNRPPKKFRTSTDPAASAPVAPPAASAVTVPTPTKAALLQEIIGNLGYASQAGLKLLKNAVAKLAEDRERAFSSPALNALNLAIWSDKAAIDRAEVERLRPLWVRYFDA